MALNATNSRSIEKRLEQINDTLSSISAKEVLFIITLSLLTVLVSAILCLDILEKRKRRKQSSVPQAIVIQPTNGKNEKSGRSDKSKMSSVYEKDVLPSKSMKMKVAISPSMSTVKKSRALSKEVVAEDGPASRSESSRAESSKIEASQPDKVTVKKPVELDVHTAVEPASSVTTPGVAPSAATALPAASSASSTAPAAPSPAVTAPGVPASNASSSLSNDSITSFTVPEDGTTNRTKSPASVPKSAAPSTPTATTLSGVSAAPTLSDSSSVAAKSAGQMATAKDVTAGSKSPMSPLRNPEPAAPAPPLPAIVTSTPPPLSEKKI